MVYSSFVLGVRQWGFETGSLRIIRRKKIELVAKVGGVL